MKFPSELDRVAVETRIFSGRFPLRRAETFRDKMNKRARAFHWALLPYGAKSYKVVKVRLGKVR